MTTPTWTPDGESLVYAGPGGQGPQSILQVSLIGGNPVELIGEPGIAAGFPDFRKYSSLFHYRTDGEILAQYQPELRYTRDETFRADAVNTITDNYVSNPPFPSWSNYLLGPSGNIIASANPNQGWPQLSLDVLSYQAYPAGPGDKLDEAGGPDDSIRYRLDAQRLHRDSHYRDRLYGRLKSSLDGRRAVQYWIWYYYNPKDFVFTGRHEGDWELVQYELAPDQAIEAATYAQHDGAERCAWDHVARSTSGQPIVYVASGSHASYFSPGPHLIETTIAFDQTASNGPRTATWTVNNITRTPSWAFWPGSWGASGRSPEGPPYQGDKWDDPFSWSSGRYCTEGQTFPKRAVLPRTLEADKPVAPRFKAVGRGQHIVISYTLPQRGKPLAGRGRPRRIVATLQATGRAVVPLTVTVPARRQGRIVLPLGLGRWPRVVTLKALSHFGVSSRTVTAMVNGDGQHRTG